MTFDIEKQIQYWSNGSDEDFKAADMLIKNQMFQQGLTFAHLALEKILKAHVVKVTNDHPPKIHNLKRLIELSQLSLCSDYIDILLEFNTYNLSGRSHEFIVPRLDHITAKQDLANAKEVRKWLKNLLSK